MANKVRKRQVQIVVDVKSKKAVSAIRELTKKTEKGFRDMGKQIRSTFGPFKRLKDSILAVGAAVPLLKDAFRAATAAIRVFINAGQQASRLAGEQEQGIRSLSFALGRLGIEYEDVSAGLDAFILGLEDSTTAGDEAIRETLSQFATLSGGAIESLEEMQRATTLVMDVVSTGVARSSREVSRGIAQIYAGNLEALRSLLPGQQELIDRLKDIEDASTRAGFALGLLRDTYDGAREAADQFDVQISSTRSAFEEALQQFGSAMREGIVESGVLVQLTEAFRDLSAWIAENRDGIVEFFERWGSVLRTLAAGFEVLVDRLYVLWQIVGPTGGLLGDFGEVTRNFWETRDAASAAADELDNLNRVGQGWQTSLGRQLRASGADLIRAGLEPEEDSRDPRRGQADASPFAAAMGITGGALEEAKEIRDAANQSRLLWQEAIAEQKGAFEALVVGLTEAQMAMLDFEAINQSLARSSGEAWAEGFSIATDALNGFATTLPRIMGESAESGAERIAAVFQFLGQAAQVAAAVGVAAKASTAWLGPISAFFSMGAAAASFASSLGSGGGGGTGRAGAGVRGAIGSEASDVLVGQRPEATRGGITRNIQISAGYVLNNTESRRQLGAMIMEAQQLNEIRGSVVG